MEIFKIMNEVQDPESWVKENSHKTGYFVCVNFVGKPTSFGPGPVSDMRLCMLQPKERYPFKWYAVLGKKLSKAVAAIDGAFLTNYITYHVMMDGGILCHKCLGEKMVLVADAVKEPGTNTQWEYLGTEINYHEEEGLCCDHCGAAIPASYGE